VLDVSEKLADGVLAQHLLKQVPPVAYIDLKLSLDFSSRVARKQRSIAEDPSGVAGIWCDVAKRSHTRSEVKLDVSEYLMLVICVTCSQALRKGTVYIFTVNVALSLLS
jgi:hypothetical protein